MCRLVCVSDVSRGKEISVCRQSCGTLETVETALRIERVMAVKNVMTFSFVGRYLFRALLEISPQVVLLRHGGRDAHRFAADGMDELDRAGVQ